MKYLKYFETTEGLTGMEVATPFVGAIEGKEGAMFGKNEKNILSPNGKGSYKVIPPQEIRLVADVDDISITYIILGNLFTELDSSNTEMYVDGDKKTFSKTYKFPTTGEHTIVYKISDDVVIGNATKMFNIYDTPDAIKLIDVSNLNLDNITTLHTMFQGCANENRLESIIGLDKTNTSNVNTAIATFNQRKNMISAGNLSNWNVDNVTNMQHMFHYCLSLTFVGDLSNWNVGNVTNMQNMFNNCLSLTFVGDLSNWNVGKVTNMQYMFCDCNTLSFIGDLSRWNVGNVTSMLGLFSECHALATIGDLSGWNVGKVTNMRGMFGSCITLFSIGDLSGWNVGNVTDMGSMFSICPCLKTIGNIKQWNVSKVTNLSYTFGNYGVQVYDGESDCFVEGKTQADLDALMIEEFDLSGWNTKSCTTIQSIFTYTQAIKKINLSGWNVSSLQNMNGAFHNSRWLKEIDLSGWNLPSTVTHSSLFTSCSRLERIIAKNCSQTTLDIINAELTSAGLSSQVQVVTV